jgi:hypothetical protein
MTGKAPPFGGNSKTWSSVKSAIESTSDWTRLQRIVRSLGGGRPRGEDDEHHDQAGGQDEAPVSPAVPRFFAIH